MKKKYLSWSKRAEALDYYTYPFNNITLLCNIIIKCIPRVTNESSTNSFHLIWSTTKKTYVCQTSFQTHVCSTCQRINLSPASNYTVHSSFAVLRGIPTQETTGTARQQRPTPNRHVMKSRISWAHPAPVLPVPGGLHNRLSYPSIRPHSSEGKLAEKSDTGSLQDSSLMQALERRTGEG